MSIPSGNFTCFTTKVTSNLADYLYDFLKFFVNGRLQTMYPGHFVCENIYEMTQEKVSEQEPQPTVELRC